MTQDQHIQAACANGKSLSTFDIWILVGEWSPAITDCALHLGGVPSRYDGTYPGSPVVGCCYGLTGSGLTFSTAYKTFLRKFWEAQVQAYEKGQGWIMWTWKMEFADEWSYQAGLRYGWIPQNPTNYQFPDICG
jgi:glucan 1,3-beta-glucosidase